MHRYVALRKKLLGVDELHMYDVYVPMVSEYTGKVTYEEAVETALKALLIDTQKNIYLPQGHNFQTADRLRIYLPGNGALLTAVAMMCAGWDGCAIPSNPGFPQDGKWNVRWEGLQRMQ